MTRRAAPLAAVATLIALTIPAAAAAAIAVDQSISSDGFGARTTAAFSTSAAGEVLIAFAASDGPPTAAQTLTVSGAGLVWTLVQRTNAQMGTSEIWTAATTSILTNVTVTCTQSFGGFYQSMTVIAFGGAGGVGASAGRAAPNGAPTVSLVTTRAGSLVYGIGNDWDYAIARTPGAGQTIAHQYLAPAGDTMWVQNLVNPAAAAGATAQLDDTAPTADQWNFAAVEIVPALAAAFDVSAYNDSLTLGRSDSGTYNLLIAPSGDFTGSVDCTVTGLPADAAGVFEPPNGPPHPGPFALILTTGAAASAGLFHPSVTCVNGTLSATRMLTLTITTDPDFRVVVEPNSLIVAQNRTGSANVNVQAMNGYASSVTLAATGLPSGASAAFTPSAPAVPGASAVEFTIGASTAPGVYHLAITATDAFVTRQTPFDLTVAQQNTSGAWREQALGDTPALFYGVIVGDVGNTGRNRVYASGGQGVMYEYAFDGVSWSFSRMPVGVTADAEMHNLAIGPGRGDGVNRLYIAVSGGDKVYECSWVNAAWQCPIMVNLVGATDIIIGDGRNDGRTRVYTTWMAGTTEFTWNGTGWTALTMSSNETGWVHGIDLGQGRNDGINRIYTANQGNGQVHEYSWNGTNWTKLLIGSSTDMRNVEVGQGRNDGKNRVYTASGDGNVYEFTWTGSAWQSVALGNAGTAGVKVQSIPAIARSDNLVRVYAASSDGGVDEYTWTGSAWQTLRLGAATAYMYGLAAGDGLNKGTVQIYGASYDGNAYLFEWVPATIVTVPDVVSMTESAATAAITNAGLTVGTIGRTSSTSVPSGSVISQDPAAGKQAPSSSPVNLIVSTGPPPVPVPDVVNLTQPQATASINNAGFVVGAVTNESSTTVPSGSVIRQNPAGGTLATPGSAVALVISSGPPAVTLAVDKVVFSDGSGRRVTPAFSTAAPGELLIAFAASDGPTSGGQTLTVSGAGLTWTLVRRANTQLGTSEIWKTTAASQLTNVTVSSTQTLTGFHQSLTVVAFSGAGGTGATNIAGALTGAPSVSLTTTRAGSLVYGIGNDWDNSVARVPGTNQTLVHQWVDTSTGDTYWVQARSSTDAASGTLVQLNDTAPATDRWNLAAVEIVVK